MENKNVFVRAKAGAELIGVGESTLWAWAKNDPSFPKPISMGKRTTLFSVPELVAWVLGKRGAK